jgi:dihydrolipoamide dehydrogenase
MANDYNLVVIGGGPGGYVGAIRAAQLGMKVACVEKRGALGGTCLNVGCIPSKALLEVQHKLNLKKMLQNKDAIVKGLTGGIEMLFKKNKVDYIKGHGEITGTNEVTVGKKKISTDHIIIATGSEVMPLPGVEVDGKQIVSSDEAINLPSVPKHLAIIGAGVIGLELGSVWRRLGAKVTVVEYLDRITPGMDNDVSKQFQKILEKQGIEFKLGYKVTEAKKAKTGVTLSVEPAAGGELKKMKANVVLVAIGRRPHTDKVGLENVGIKTDERGRIIVNDHWQTGVPNIYAIGDVIAGPMLAHKAEEEGVAVAEILGGQHGHVNYNIIPGVVYTHPEVASVGQTEEQLKEAGVAYKAGKFTFMANSRARAINDSDGFVKVLADKETDQVLGVHIIGPQAGDLIHECCVAMEFGASAEDIARTCHAHPTLSEAVKEAAMAVDKRQIHS